MLVIIENLSKYNLSGRPVPSQNQLSGSGLTMDQYIAWKKNNPYDFNQKMDLFLNSPEARTAMLYSSLASGRYASASRHLAAVDPRYAETRNRKIVNRDLAAARQYYNLN